MEAGLIIITLAFVEGVALILSPCILPILPIVLSGSLTGSNRKPFGIIAGFIFSFALLTLFSRFIINFFHINPDLIRNIAFVLLIFLGIVMMSSKLSLRFASTTQKIGTIGYHAGLDKKTGFWHGFLFGCLIGLIWTPCAGPILAAVIVQVVTQQTSSLSLLTVLAFALVPVCRCC